MLCSSLFYWLIWDYGAAIPEIENKDSIIVMPKESLFGLLMFPKEIDSLKETYSSYSFTKLSSVDINAVTKGEKGYSERLEKDYYLVKKLN